MHSVHLQKRMVVQLGMTCNHLDDFKDEFHVINQDGYDLTIPLYAYRPKPIIIFEPFLNLGFVSVGNKKTFLSNRISF